MHNHLELFVHLVWATYDRLPFIEDEWKENLFRELKNEAERVGCKVIEVGGIEDHVHLLIKIPATISIAEVVKQIKGASSLFVNDTIRPNLYFKWQGNYSAFTISRWDVKKVANYIRNQVQHHAEGTIKLALELPINKPINS